MLFCSIGYNANAQDTIQPKAYPICIDNIVVAYHSGEIDTLRIPKVLFENYYKNFLDKGSKKETFFKSIKGYTLHKNSSSIREQLSPENGEYISIITQKAGKGYLAINEAIRERIIANYDGYKDFGIIYVCNGKRISTTKEVKKLIRLGAKNLQILSIVEDKEQKTLTVSFTKK